MTNLARFLDHNEMEPWDILFKDLFNRNSFFLPVVDSKTSYPVDIREEEKGLVFDIAVAGINKEDINIDECDNVLTIAYTKEDGGEIDGKNYIHKSIARRSFNFAWKISDKYDLKHIEAAMDKGILTVLVPKAESKEVTKQKIQIK
ncbi:MAG: Hsp20/alpha crystallin family protein [Clostridia bacterium]